jgi:hypothetical protein
LRVRFFLNENAIIMDITMILEMAASAGDRAAITAEGRSLTAAELLELSRGLGRRWRDHSAVLYLGANHLAFAEALFASAWAGIPLVPLNYRLSREQLAFLLGRQEAPWSSPTSTRWRRGPVSHHAAVERAVRRAEPDVPRWADDPRRRPCCSTQAARRPRPRRLSCATGT